MIGKYCTIILWCSILSGQFSTNTINGFGNNSHIISPSSESMGGMWMYNSNINNWDPLLASSIYKTDLTMIAVSSSFEGINTNSYNINNHLVNSVNFSFPINKNTGISVGLSPYTRTSYSIEDDQYSMIGGNEHSYPLGSKSSYDIQGGISRLSIALSLGVKDIEDNFKRYGASCLQTSPMELTSVIGNSLSEDDNNPMAAGMDIEVKNFANSKSAAYFKVDEKMKRFAEQMKMQMGNGIWKWKWD